MNEMGVAIAAILAALGSLVTTIAMAVSGGRKLDQIHVQTNSNMSAAMERVTELEDQIKELRNSKLQDALDRIGELESQLESR